MIIINYYSYHILVTNLLVNSFECLLNTWHLCCTLLRTLWVQPQAWYQSYKSVIINPILIRVIQANTGCQIYHTLTAISPTSTLHLARFMTSSFSKPTLLLSFSTYNIFHVFFGPPRFLLPFTSNSNTFLKTSLASLLNTCP